MAKELFKAKCIGNAKLLSKEWPKIVEKMDKRPEAEMCKNCWFWPGVS
jgi:hypothetical protein